MRLCVEVTLLWLHLASSTVEQPVMRLTAAMDPALQWQRDGIVRCMVDNSSVGEYVTRREVVDGKQLYVLDGIVGPSEASQLFAQL